MKNVFFALVCLFAGLTVCAAQFDYSTYQKTALNKRADYLRSCDVIKAGNPMTAKLQLAAMLQPLFKAGQKVTAQDIIKKACELNPNYTAQSDAVLVATIRTMSDVCTLEQTKAFYQTLKNKQFANWAGREYMAHLHRKKKFAQILQLQIPGDMNMYDTNTKRLAAIRLKNRQKVWEYSVKMFDQFYVPNAKLAMDIIKKMFELRPKTVTNEQVAQFLKMIGDKYPTPGTDFETWRGFMGFVGFRYKSITGKDLFNN